MMPAAKHGDMQIGVDIHLCMVPPGVPTPLPTPHMSVVFDPFDYVPIIGATVTVCGMKRATAGTSGKVVHIPPGFPFAPKMPDTEDEIFMGSATVDADGDPFSHIAHPVLACQMVGMVSPFRKKKKGGPRAMVLPTVFNLAIPTTVFIGGPPTISLMGLAVKGAFSALGKLAKSKIFKRLRQKVFKNMKPGFLKCVVLRAEPVNILDGSVSVEQEDFSLPGRLPIEWLRSYSSSDTYVGICGRGWQCLADIRLEVDPADGSVMLQGPGIGPVSFDRLPTQLGNAGLQVELTDGARLSDLGSEWLVQPKGERTYHFPKTLASRDSRGKGIAPIGSISDRTGNRLDFEYRDGQPAVISESTGRSLVLTVVNGRLLAVILSDPATQPEHGIVRYDYDSAGDLTSVTDALGVPYRFAYAPAGMVKHTDRNGLSFHYDYDDQSRVIRAWGDGGLYDYTFEYLDALNQRRIIDSHGHVSTIQLNDTGLPICEIDPQGGQTTFEYDDAGRTTGVTDPTSARTKYEYDDAGNLLLQEHPDGAAFATQFDCDHNPTQIIDPGGNIWLQHWDARGLLIKQVSPLGHTSLYEYDSHGQLVSCTNPRGAKTDFLFDRVGNLTQIRDPLGHRTSFTHDHLGNVVSKRDPLGRSTDYQYDRKGRLVSMQQASGSGLHFSYDAEDNLASYTDENGATTILSYFGQGEIASRTLPDGQRIDYFYDTEERLIGVRNQRGEHYELRRDSLGRVVEERDYWGQSRFLAYDAAGRLVSGLDPLGRRIDYTCDPVGRILRKQYAPRPGALAEDATESFAYDPNGNLVAASNQHVRLLCEFDADGRRVLEVQEHVDGTRFSVASHYDEQGNRTRQATENSFGTKHTVDYTFDLRDQVVGIRIDQQAESLLRRNELGHVTQEELAPGVVRRMDYNADDLLVQQELDVFSNSPGSKGPDQVKPGIGFAVHYEYDRAGNLVRRHDSQFGVDRLVHDPMGRVLQHCDPQGALHNFFADPAGDRLSTFITSMHDAHASIEGWGREGLQDGTLYRFDRAGNLVEKTDPECHLHLTWDCHQRLAASRAARGGREEATTYGYDPLGRRVYKETAGQRTWFGWDGDTLGQEVGACARQFVYQPESFEPFALLGDNAAPQLFYINDPNGCPTRLVDPKGLVFWAGTWSPFGGADGLQVDLVKNPLRLQGQYADAETGLHYNRFRYYCRGINQYISADPLGLAPDDNTYGFAPNCQAWADPLGLAKCKTHGHHAWPKYLGGAKKQKLVPLSAAMHKKYHKGLDKVLPRWKGKKYYDALTPKVRKQALKDLKDYTKAFDKKYGTKLFQAMKQNGFPIK